MHKDLNPAAAPAATPSNSPVSDRLDAFWMPFTASRQFKSAPRLLAKAKDMHYWTPEGRQILDAVRAGRYTNVIIGLHNYSLRPANNYGISAQAKTLWDSLQSFQSLTLLHKSLILQPPPLQLLLFQLSVFQF